MSIFKTTMSWLGLGPDTDYEPVPNQQSGLSDPGLDRAGSPGADASVPGSGAQQASQPSGVQRVESPTRDEVRDDFTAVRSLGPVSGGHSSSGFGGSDAATGPGPAMTNKSLRPMQVDREAEPSMGSVLAVPPGAGSRPQIVAPRSFNDAQDVGDRFRSGVPVLLNLKEIDADLGRRFIDFCSGLCYGLRGQMQRVGDRVFLLIPVDIHLSAEDRRMLNESGLLG